MKTERFHLLDALRGVAALVVLGYHFGEAFATSAFDQFLNHGHLAVDFFFILSGFVIGYSYDSRFPKMKIGEFLKRRVIRLQPMVVFAAVLGVLSFLLQGSVRWDGSCVELWAVLLAFGMQLFLIPAYPGAVYDVRGNNEMFSLNGPSWSLFFEYIANVFYAFFLRKLSTKWLVGLVVAAGVGLLSCSVFNLSGSHHLGVGWSLMDYGFIGGLMRVTFSFSMGLLLARNYRKWKVKMPFFLSVLVLLIVFSLPYIGNEECQIFNGLYEAGCVLFVFPFVVKLAASGSNAEEKASKTVEFLGNISYPLYIIQYPVLYLFYFYCWSGDSVKSFSETWQIIAILYVLIVGMAFLVYKFYDAPVRKWLSGRK